MGYIVETIDKETLLCRFSWPFSIEVTGGYQKSKDQLYIVYYYSVDTIKIFSERKSIFAKIIYDRLVSWPFSTEGTGGYFVKDV